jgi:sugar lactone lactonase YvrE
MFFTSVRFPPAVIVFVGAVLSFINSARSASASATVGQTVTLSVTADGTPPFSYQWYKDSAAIEGATTASFSISSLKAADAGTYCAFIANAAGSTFSDNAVLAVYAATDAPVFTTQPVSQTAATAQSATFSVTAGGSQTTTFQWQRLPAGSATWENLAEGGSYRGVSTGTLTVSAITTAMAGDQFRCLTTNSSGSATSTAAALTVSGGSATLIHYPASIAEDASGNLYVADASGNTIEKITSAGAVSTLAGLAGMAGSQDGTGSNARFNQPTGVAIDGAGNLYVADTGNAMVRKITQDGVVSTLAGSAARGNQDGVGSAASFKAPTGIALDGAGNLYVADAFNATIRKITSAGSVSTLAGMAGSWGDADGAGSAARFNYPSGVTVDTAGNVYVADTYNDTIRKIDSSGLVTTLAGSAGVSGGNDGTGIYALFNQPVGVTVDASGNVCVADTGNATIRKVTPGGAVITLAGMGGIAGLGNSSGGVVLFNQPRGLVADSAGNLFVADTGNAAIRKIAADGTVTTLTLTAASAATTTTQTPSTSSTTPVSSVATDTTAGGGGGGGTMESSFVLMLILLAACRKAGKREFGKSGNLCKHMPW